MSTFKDVYTQMWCAYKCFFFLFLYIENVDIQRRTYTQMCEEHGVEPHLNTLRRAIGEDHIKTIEKGFSEEDIKLKAQTYFTMCKEDGVEPHLEVRRRALHEAYPNGLLPDLFARISMDLIKEE